jgi:small-conductance mechanosensitive channel
MLMNTRNSLLGFALVAVCWPAIAQEQKLPSPYYITEDIQYFPPGPEFKLQREAAALKAQQDEMGAKAASGSQPGLLPVPLTAPIQSVQPAASQANPVQQVQALQVIANPPAMAAVPPAVNQPPAPAAESDRTTVLREKFLGQAGEAWDHVASVWNFVIIRGAEGKALVSVGTLVGGLFLMGFGYIAAGMISRWIGKRLLSRLGLNQTASAPLQKISYYVLLATFGMLTLNILNVPITAFSFAGGALAVGVGFGSQNIVNNFISGLILIAERPIRVGDVIEIDGRTGKVTEIGARSTRIATGTNLEVIVPNSKFLESQVVNWTLSDDRISTSVKVGVSYGSPTREVERLLRQAAVDHEHVALDPAPAVAFEDFADDALVFSVSFWINLQTASKGKVESDIRFRIDELFNQAGIVIAYPQRDVHLNVMRPLEVRLAPEASRELRRVAA